jgi:acyl-CoA reductase-like NAD-dependent aldehyde dehydrogenase
VVVGLHCTRRRVRWIITPHDEHAKYSNFQHQTREIISVRSSTGEEIGRAAVDGRDDVAAAVSRGARGAQPAWARLSYRERARFILRAREIVLEQLEEIAKLISRETGKPRY